MKEKLNKKMLLAVQRSLYRDFKKTCEEQYKTKSEVIRDFMLRYIKEHRNGEEINN